ncbi:hypothetical protein CHS0354_008547 [Potamilus streckersoni]|uniref:Uncharacterized protein n=1 Tax=Potamilus streckersoni TaxID=2493646 RepID=A0AAE0RSA4_9BIVA|nr:hypothetical protein CHS0354_008547 [Potamilus streckersoni]
MFVTVKFGDGQSKIFNINCRNDILLHFIKKGCQCSRDDIVDVSDEQGFVKNLRNYPLDYGNDHLKDRETLVLLKVETNGEMDDAMSTSDKTIFTPMLVGLENNQEFNDNLNPRHDKNLSRLGSLVDPNDIANKTAYPLNKVGSSREDGVCEWDHSRCEDHGDKDITSNIVIELVSCPRWIVNKGGGLVKLVHLSLQTFTLGIVNGLGMVLSIQLVPGQENGMASVAVVWCWPFKSLVLNGSSLWF